MPPELSDLEYHNLFSKNLKELKFEIDELNKMLEARLENLTKNLCDGLGTSAYKSLKSEVFRAIDGANNLSQLCYIRLISNFEKSFQALEEEKKDE